MRSKRLLVPSVLWLPLTATVAVLAAGLVQGATYPETILADGPVAYYRLEQTDPYAGVADYSATGAYSGAYGCDQNDGCTPLLGQPGIDTNSVLFHPQTIEGVVHQSYITVPYSPDLNTQVFSVEAWVRAFSAGATSYRAAVSSYNHNNGSEGWFFYQTPAAGGSSWVWVQQYGGIWISGGSVKMYEWQHLAASSDGTTLKFYVNGQLAGTAGQTGVAPNSASPLIIGALNEAAPNTYFDGNIDEVALYNTTLTETQIQNHYQVGLVSFRTNALPPTITSNPSSVTNYAGYPVTFQTSADGTKPLSYQWYKNGSVISGATNSALTFTCTLADNNASYKTVVTNLFGTQESTVATLSVLTNLMLATEPYSITRTEGSKAAFRVAADGALPISYQWYKDSAPIPGATNATLWLSNISVSDNGAAFYAHVFNPYCSTNSDTATLSVNARGSTVTLTRYGKVVAADDPVAYWRFDQTDAGQAAVDVVGSFDGVFEDASAGSTGVFTFGAPTGIPYETNAAVSVTGGAWMRVPYALELNPYGPFTMETWVQPSSLSADGNDYRSLLGTLGNGVGGPIGWHIYQIPSHQWIIAVWGDNWINTWLYDTDDTIQANQWYHMVVAYDGAYFKMYVNGLLRIDDTWPNFIQNNNGAFVFGWRTDKDWKPFSGTIDDVAIYNKELTQSQVQAHYAASVRLSITQQDNKVILSWPFGSLQQASSANGTYSTLDGVTSPYTNTVSGAKFYRVLAY